MSANQPNAQMLCWNCEEVVHRYAIKCPYCQKDLSGPAAKNLDDSKNSFSVSLENSPSSNIQPSQLTGNFGLQKTDSIHAKMDSRVDDLDQHAQESTESGGSTSIVRQIIPLIFLLSGSFFFFFGLLVRLFSENGVFVLKWSESSWPYFVVPSALLLAFGYFFLPHMDD